MMASLAILTAPLPLFGRLKRRYTLYDQYYGIPKINGWKLRPMSDKQKEVLAWAFDKGADAGYPETMWAIAWQESSCGENLENPHDRSDGSYGIFGSTIRSAANRFHKHYHMILSDQEVQDLLVYYPDFAAAACIWELDFWKKVRGEGRWTQIWASYNAGWAWKKGLDYADDIREKIVFLRTV